MTLRGIICIFLLFVSLSSCASLPPANMSPKQDHVHVMTYNINWGMRHYSHVLQHIKQSEADIIFLQETHPSWQKLMARELSSQFPHMHFEEHRGAGGIAFLSKYPLRNVTRIEPTHGWFPALTATVNTPIGPLQLLNLHLRPSLNDDGSFGLSAYFYMTRTREKEVEGFLKQCPPSPPLIMAGDFNECDDDAIDFVESQGFINTLNLYDKSSDTWEWPYGILTFDDRFDHIYVSPTLTCTGAKVTSVDASDHFPVEAVVVKALE